ncbi:MAG: gamma-glutamyltransferase [SAR202 cluster bacterium Io17-Chloro-G2]|nr:MAG: gamma-glutamyltransferase [SAR202 cluster bacterium Io17-Chloro-G2]
MFFDSRRSTVHAKNGMVATSQPLAAMAGLKILMDGGNPVDAAVAAAAALNVVEVVSTGVGGDMFALVWNNADKSIRAINGSGHAPAAASAKELRDKGHKEMPFIGVESITVPGTVHGWETILNECGTMPLSEVLKPAIRYAEEGFPVTDYISYQWSTRVEKLNRLPSGQELLIDGRAPRHGEVMRLPNLGATLRAVAEGGTKAFYTGKIAEKTAAFIQEQGGWMTTQDLAAHTSDWEEPISTDYRGITCWESPPANQGIAGLEALNIAEGWDVAAMGSQTAETYHHFIEAMRLAFADAFRYVGDPASSQVPTAQLLSKEYAATRRALIDPHQAMKTAPYGQVTGGSDTVYITCVDGKGNACSFINSVYENFGTGMVVPGTGIALHNRGSLFSLEPGHPNELAPNKRPYHTIIPALATKNNELYLCYGMMGAFMQPQGHLQLIRNMVDFGMDPQKAINALRFMVVGDGVLLEEGLPADVVAKIQRMGHGVQMVSGYQRVGIGGAQIIQRDPETGVLSGGSEPRKDGCAVGW